MALYVQLPEQAEPSLSSQHTFSGRYLSQGLEMSPAPGGERSRVVAEATEREIRRRQRLEALERVRALGDELERKYGQMPSCAEDIRQMREERNAKITGLR